MVWWMALELLQWGMKERKKIQNGDFGVYEQAGDQFYPQKF